MIITSEQAEGLLEAAKPLIKWLNEHGHPHNTAIVDNNSVELVEGVAMRFTKEFLKD